MCPPLLSKARFYQTPHFKVFQQHFQCASGLQNTNLSFCYSRDGVSKEALTGFLGLREWQSKLMLMQRLTALSQLFDAKVCHILLVYKLFFHISNYLSHNSDIIVHN